MWLEPPCKKCNFQQGLRRIFFTVCQAFFLNFFITFLLQKRAAHFFALLFLLVAFLNLMTLDKLSRSARKAKAAARKRCPFAFSRTVRLY